MDRKAALATAAGLVLVVAGAASALTSTWLTPPGEAATASTTAPVVVEYVDEFGNPVEPPGSTVPDPVVVQRSAEPEQIVITLPSADVVFESVSGGPATSFGDDAFDDDHEDDEHEDDEHEDEHEDEHDD